MASIPALRRLLALATVLKIKFCLFWGIPCRMPITTANDDLVFLRACARAKWKVLFYQKLPIWVMMTPFALIFLYHPNDKLIVALMYLFPTFIVGVIAVVAGTLSATRGSFDIQTRNEYARLLHVEEAASPKCLSSAISATDITDRMSFRVFGYISGNPTPLRRGELHG